LQLTHTPESALHMARTATGLNRHCTISAVLVLLTSLLKCHTICRFYASSLRQQWVSKSC